jgi:hypothetical protein
VLGFSLGRYIVASYVMMRCGGREGVCMADFVRNYAACKREASRIVSRAFL